MQLELFPDYPRLSPADLPPVHDWAKDWELFDYPSDDLESMGQSPQQADILTYLKGVFEAVMANAMTDYFVGNDTFLYYSMKEKVRNKAGNLAYKTKQKVRAPDILLAQGAARRPRKSFILEEERKHLGKNRLYMIAIEVMSESNYDDKEDAANLMRFYHHAGVDEFIIVHTKPQMFLDVYWRLGGTLQRILFADNYKIQSLNVHFEVDTTWRTLPPSDVYQEDSLFVVNSANGEQFGNYATELEIRKKTQEHLKESQEYIRRLEETRLHAEEEARAERETRLHAEEEARAEREARLHAEEELRKILFELEELRNLARVQKDYE